MAGEICPDTKNYMNRIDRLFGILTLLQSKKYVTAGQIASKFGISERTVYRDIKALQEQGVPVSFEQPKGYFIVQGYFLPPVSFTTEEANALLLMESLVHAFSDMSIKKNYSSALNKVRSVGRSSQKEIMEILDRHMRTQLPACFPQDYEYLTLIQNCISAGTVISIGYKNSKEEVTERKIEPIGLIFYALSWHLIGWCTLRNEYRDFKVSRILRASDTGSPFKTKEHTGLDEYMKQLPVNF
jgi:predicted DNA-binding transcriptional regulator YafY